MSHITKILATTDCSEASVEVMNYAVKIANKNQAEIIVLYVVSSLRSVVSNVLSKTGEAKVIAAEDQLERFWQSVNKNDMKVELVVKYGDPFSEIISYAENHNNDVMVMGTNGRTGLTHVVMGSVAEKVVRYSSIPVIIVKKEPSVIPDYFSNIDYEYDSQKLY